MIKFILNNKFALKKILSAPNEIRQLYKLKNKVEGKKAFILGSAPNPNLDLYNQQDTLVSVNASAANAKKLGLKDPDITVVDFELINQHVAFNKGVRAVIVKNNYLRNINLGSLVAAQSNNTLLGDPNILNANFRDFLTLHKFTRKLILNKVCKNNKLEETDTSIPSTGAFACALCFFLGAKEIIISGFSFLKKENSHPAFYETEDKYYTTNTDFISSDKIDTRSHSLADSNLITSLAIDGREIKTLEREILPLIQNWGNPKSNK